MYVFVDVPTVTTKLVTAGGPASVQVILDASLPGGTAFTLVGSTADGRTWAVPGGSGIATGEQMVFTDNRTPLNIPITYVLTTGGQTYESPIVIVEHPGKYLIQSLDGRTVLDFVWVRNGLPQEPVVNSVTFDVDGRERPPGRYAVGGDGGGAIQIRTTQENSARLRDLLKSGRPLVVRTDGAVRDFPPVDLILPRGGPSRLWDVVAPGGKTMGTDRVWDIPYLFVDDPEPSAPLAVFTWDDFDEAMSTFTWDDHDALFVGADWDAWDTYEWPQL